MQEFLRALRALANNYDPYHICKTHCRSLQSIFMNEIRTIAQMKDNLFEIDKALHTTHNTRVNEYMKHLELHNPFLPLFLLIL